MEVIMKNFLLILILIFCSTLLFSQVNFELDFSFEKIDSDDELTNLQLFDYDYDGIDEIIVGYQKYSWPESDGKCVIYNQIGDTLSVIPFDCGTERIFKHASLFCIDSINYLASFFIYSDNNLYDGQIFYLFEIYQLNNMSLIGSEMVYLGNNVFDIEDFNFSINFIEHLLLGSEPCICVGINKTHSYWSAYSYYYDISNLFRYSFHNNSLTFIDEFETIGHEIRINNEINKVVVSGDSLSYYSPDPAYSGTSKSYRIVTFENDYNPTIQQIDYIAGGKSYDYQFGTTYNNYIQQSIFLSDNDLNINNFGLLSYNQIYDDDIGTTTIHKNFLPDFSDTLWIKYDTQTGTELITVSTCVSVNNEDHYVMYFREDQLEIRDRIDGDIVHHQNSSISPFTIKRKSDGELLFFVEQEDETGYDVYVPDGEIQVSADDNQLVVTSYQLSNYPNPFNPETTIKFSIPQENKVELIVYNIKGQKVKTLVDKTMIPGRYSVIWDSKDQNGKPVSSGIYFYKLDIDGKIRKIRKMLLLK